MCLWCHTEHHSTDRLKYHLSRGPHRLHGLRVTVGQVYEYGSGTKRTGARQHRGMPPVRLAGPLNATPAQRAAAAEGRACTERELSDELFRVAGTRDVFSWPEPLPSPSHAASLPGNLVPLSHGCQPDLSVSPSAIAPVARWFTLLDFSGVQSSDWHTPSPLWGGLLSRPFVCQFPSSWHQYWKLWHAMQHTAPWSVEAFRAAAPLRRAVVPPAVYGALACHPPPALLDFLAATVAFRSVCDALLLRGSAWISGVPSRPGISLLRSLLPHAAFHVLPVASGRLFVVEHASSSSPVWRSELRSLFSSSPAASTPRVLPLRTSFVYHTRSLG